MSKATVRQVTIDPEFAAELLALNTNNRPVKAGRVDGYVRDMKAGNWHFDGEPIRVADDGQLLDGQHRLAAIVRSGIAQPAILVEGLAREAQTVMDTGARRSLADALKLNGHGSAINLGAAVRINYAWDRGSRYFDQIHGTVPEFMAYFDKHPEIAEANRHGMRIGSATQITASVAALGWRVLSEIDQSDADFFFERAASDVGHEDDSPILAMRRAFAISERERRSARITNGTKTWQAAIMFKSWNKYRQGAPAKLLRFTPGGANPEQFPEPI